jgi:hypothetical protein
LRISDTLDASASSTAAQHEAAGYGAASSQRSYDAESGRGTTSAGAAGVRGPADEGSAEAQKKYDDPYDNPYHTEPYNQAMEQKKWNALAEKFRREHPNTNPKTEQQQIDRLWRQRFTYHYHAFGPKSHLLHPAEGGAPTAPHKQLPPLVYPPPTTGVPSDGWQKAFPPATVLGPEPETPDFDGQSAQIAKLPWLGHGPSVCVCLCVCVCVCVCVRACVCARVLACVRVRVRLRLRVCLRVRLSLRVCLRVRVRVRVRV